MQHDPARWTAYTDFMPTDLEEFLKPMQKEDIRVWMFLVDADIGGVFYLHDGGTDAAGAAYAWVGAYIMPPYRGRHAAHAWRLIRRACEREGVCQVFAAIRGRNRPAQCFITHKMGFTRLGTYTDWSYFEGCLDRVIIYTMRWQDQSLAWVLAEHRAQQFRRGAPPVQRTRLPAVQETHAARELSTQALTAWNEPIIYMEASESCTDWHAEAVRGAAARRAALYKDVRGQQSGHRARAGNSAAVVDPARREAPCGVDNGCVPRGQCPGEKQERIVG